MSVAWNDILQLPESALAGDRRVPKTQIVKQGGLTRSQAAMLDKVQEIRFFASLTKSNSYIQPVKNDLYDIESVIFLVCELKTSAVSAETLRNIHDCFPNPTVLLVAGPDKENIAISVTIRRKSQAERGTFVTERVQSTGPFAFRGEEYEPYLERIAFCTLPQTDLLSYAVALGDRSMLARSVCMLGYYPICEDADADLLMGHVKQMNMITSEINDLQKRRRAKDASLAETTKMRVKIRQLETERDSVADEIKELCDGR